MAPEADEPDEAAVYRTQAEVDLPSGDALNENQAEEIVRENECKVIVVAGPFSSGKTTILTSLYEAFLEAPFANYLFRGSKTLIGFEKRSHLGREESGLASPETTHTSIREGVLFLHLELASQVEGFSKTSGLLLSDVSGERFRELRDSTAASEKFTSLRRADHLCIVVDGAKLLDTAQRQVARNDSRSILRSILEAGSLAPSCVIDVVFTKWDLIAELAEDEETKKFVADTRNALTLIAAGRNLHFHEVAARPIHGAKVPFAHGLPTLLRSWMNPVEMEEPPTIYLPSDTGREFFRATEAAIMNQDLGGSYAISRF